MGRSPSPVEQLVRAIAAYQEQAGLTDQQLADEIGVPRGTWSVAKTGGYTPGATFMRRVLDNAPRFKDLATKALLG